MKLLFENWRRYLAEQERPGPGRTQSRYEKETNPPPIRMDGFGNAIYYATGERGRILQEEDIHKSAKVVITNEEGKVLVLKRSPESHYKPEHWDLPGGHLKKGEAEEAAATRETKEETNLDISGLTKVRTDESITWYKATSYSGDIELDLAENTDWAWVSMEELKEKEYTPDTVEIVELALGEEEDM
tara:strand:+ start:695 stop:1255 length:561 start_codon:yes stop_codon:yes gene_type:complete